MMRWFVMAGASLRSWRYHVGQSRSAQATSRSASSPINVSCPARKCVAPFSMWSWHRSPAARDHERHCVGNTSVSAEYITLSTGTEQRAMQEGAVGA